MKKTDQELTNIAYEYARKKKKVSESVIEGYKSGYNQCEYNYRKASPKVLLELCMNKYRTYKEIDYSLGYSGAMRGLNDKEKKEVSDRKLISDLIKALF